MFKHLLLQAFFVFFCSFSLCFINLITSFYHRLFTFLNLLTLDEAITIINLLGPWLCRFILLILYFNFLIITDFEIMKWIQILALLSLSLRFIQAKEILIIECLYFNYPIWLTRYSLVPYLSVKNVLRAKIKFKHHKIIVIHPKFYTIAGYILNVEHSISYWNFILYQQIFHFSIFYFPFFQIELFMNTIPSQKSNQSLQIQLISHLLHFK